MALIHTCYRITDIDRSVAFYEALGFEEIARLPIRDEAINVFMNQPGDGDMPRLELTYNFGVDSYDLGSGYGHIAITAEDLDGALAQLAEQGIEPEKPPYTVREGGRGCASSATRTATGSSSSSGRRGGRRPRRYRLRLWRTWVVRVTRGAPEPILRALTLNRSLPGFSPETLSTVNVALDVRLTVSRRTREPTATTLPRTTSWRPVSENRSSGLDQVSAI